MTDVALDLRYLEYVLLVAEHGSFRRVAEILDLSQSTVSRRVQLLERRIGIPLFERSRVGTRTTAVGARFLEEAAFGADHLRRAIREVTSSERSDRGQLRIGILHSLASGRFAELLDQLDRQFPQIELRFEEGTSRSAAAGVLNGRLDAAFLPGQPILPGCEVWQLWEEPLFVAAPRNHPLASLESVRWRSLSNERFLVSHGSIGPDIEDVLVRQLSRPGFRPAISAQKVGQENLIHMVGREMGLSIVTLSAIGAANSGVVLVPICAPGERLSSSLIWARTRRNAALKALLKVSASFIERRV